MAFVVRIDMLAAQQSRKVGNHGQNHRCQQELREGFEVQRAGGNQAAQNQYDQYTDCGGGFYFFRLQRIGGGCLRQIFAAEGIPPQTKRHADGSRAEAVMEAVIFLQQAGNDGAEEAADIDGNVENRETRIAQRFHFVAFIQRADHGAGRRFHAAATQCDAHQAKQQAGQAGDDGQQDVAEHHDDA